MKAWCVSVVVFVLDLKVFTICSSLAVLKRQPVTAMTPCTVSTGGVLEGTVKFVIVSGPHITNGVGVVGRDHTGT